MTLPQKIQSRADEITANFFTLLDIHIEDILAGRELKMFRIRDFAARLYIHPTHFSNTIKLTTGKSPCDFVEERIMDEAKRMLRETQLSVAEICYRLTYQQPTNFTKFFKAMEGMTPTQYRKQILNLP